MTTLDLLTHALRDGQSVRDEDFDAVYPLDVRALSRSFWTPVQVAARAADLLVQDRGGLRVLDVGSGPGKLCIVGALRTSAHFTGIERRARLVSIARAAAVRLGADGTTRFVESGLDDIDWEGFDAFYFYNPFMENLYSKDHRFDDSVDLSRLRFLRDLEATRRGLERVRPGARVVTYHGLGAALPPAFRLERREPAGSDHLELWVRSDRRYLRKTAI